MNLLLILTIKNKWIRKYRFIYFYNALKLHEAFLKYIKFFKRLLLQGVYFFDRANDIIFIVNLIFLCSTDDIIIAILLKNTLISKLRFYLFVFLCKCEFEIRIYRRLIVVKIISCNGQRCGSSGIEIRRDRRKLMWSFPIL